MVLVEMVVFAIVTALTWLGVDAAVAGALAKGGEMGAAGVRTVAEVEAQAQRGFLMYAAGVVALAMARLVSARRGHGDIRVPLLLPAACAAAGIGLALQMGYGNPLQRQVWPGPDFALGFLMAALLGGLFLALPKDPVEVTQPLQPVLPFLMIGSFFALRFFGSGTEAAQDTKINLWGFQPMEIVKLLFVIFLANYFGLRAEKLRHQRDKLFGLQFPRKQLLLPAVAMLIVLFGAFVLLNDLGPTLILSVVFLAMFYIVTRASGWVALAIAIVALGVFALTHVPAIAESPKVALRLKMWVDPWYNGLPFGDQTARSLWAIAAGGAQGQGLGQAPATALPAGHTDLIIAHLAEELGTVGLVFYIVIIGLVVGQGLWIAAMNRTAERSLLAAGLAILLVAQWAVIFAGNTGILPLTGVIVPFLSYGKTGMIVFVVLACLLVRLAESGSAREATQELLELRKGALGGLAGAVALLAAGIGVAIWQGVVAADDITTRGVVTLLAREPGETTDRVGHLHDPRLQAIADQIRRGDIIDRNGQQVAGTTAEGRRTYPLEDALGTVLGIPRAIVLRPGWMLERQLENTLRGFGELPDGPAMWLAANPDGGERLLFVVASQVERPEDRRKAEAMREPGESVRLLPLQAPDFRPLLPLLRMGAARREVEIKKVSADVKSRTAQITLDARLQQDAVEHPEGGGEEEPGPVGGGGPARRRHRAGAGPRAGARLRPRRPEVHAPAHRPRLRPARQEVHGDVRAVAGQDGHPRHLPGRVHGQDLHQPRGRPRGDHQPPRGLPGEGEPDLRLPVPRRTGAGLQRRLVQGDPRLPRGPHPRQHRLHGRHPRELQRLLRPARPEARARRPEVAAGRRGGDGLGRPELGSRARRAAATSRPPPSGRPPRCGASPRPRAWRPRWAAAASTSVARPRSTSRRRARRRAWSTTPAGWGRSSPACSRSWKPGRAST